MKRKTLHIKNMVCPSCITVIKDELSKSNIDFEVEKLGKVTILNHDSEKEEVVKQVLKKHGFEVIQDKELKIVEEVKLAVIDLINARPANIRNSDYISQRVGMSYSSLSKLFSQQEEMTIEKYIIHKKIEKVKELLKYGQMNLSEIASELGYSSVHHLSSQFKTVTGVPVNVFKETIGK